MLILLPISAIYSYEGHGLVAAVGTSIFVITLSHVPLSTFTILCPMARPTSILSIMTTP